MRPGNARIVADVWCWSFGQRGWAKEMNHHSFQHRKHQIGGGQKQTRPNGATTAAASASQTQNYSYIHANVCLCVCLAAVSRTRFLLFGTILLSRWIIYPVEDVWMYIWLCLGGFRTHNVLYVVFAPPVWCVWNTHASAVFLELRVTGQVLIYNRVSCPSFNLGWEMESLSSFDIEILVSAGMSRSVGMLTGRDFHWFNFPTFFRLLTVMPVGTLRECK